MAPQARGSSTIGVKKSVVATRARSSLSRKIAASSRVAASTSTRGSTTAGRCRSTWPRSTDPSLQAQPAPCERAVSRSRGEEVEGVGAGAVLLSVMVGPLAVERGRAGSGIACVARKLHLPSPGRHLGRPEHVLLADRLPSIGLVRPGLNLRPPGSGRAGPAKRAEADQGSLLLSGRAEAPIRPLPLLQRRHGAAYGRSRGRKIGR